MDGESAVAFALYIIFYLVFCIFSLLLIYTLMCRCYRISHSNPNLSMGPTISVYSANHDLLHGLEAAVIESFPKFAYLSSNVDRDTDTDMDMDMNRHMKIRMIGECMVCLGVFEKNEMLRWLPTCGHVFHLDCIDTWLRSHTTCPFCRANLLPADGPPRDMPGL